jgi:hypothetical protein
VTAPTLGVTEYYTRNYGASRINVIVRVFTKGEGGALLIQIKYSKFEIVYNMYRVKPDDVSRPSLLCHIMSHLTGARP